MIKYYFSWTKKGADYSLMGLLVRAAIFIFFCFLALLPPIHKGEYAVFKTILFIIGNVSLILTPYLQDKDSHSLMGFHNHGESPGPFVNAETPGCMWIFFGLLLWMIVGISCSSFLMEQLFAFVE